MPTIIKETSIKIPVTADENAALIHLSTVMGLSKANICKRFVRHTLIRKGLVDQTAIDSDMGLTK